MGGRRLARLSDAFDLKVDHNFLEIHPDTPPEGKPVSALGYPAGIWNQIKANLARMGKSEGIVFADRKFTTNSHRALLLAEAARDSAAGLLEELSERLFRAYFTGGRNIGDPAVLREIAKAAGVPEQAVARAWSDPAYEERLKTQGEAAARAGVTGIPTFVFADKWIVEGAVPTDTLREIARKAAAAS